MLNVQWRAENNGYNEATASPAEKRRNIIVEHVDAENARGMWLTLLPLSESFEPGLCDNSGPVAQALSFLK